MLCVCVYEWMIDLYLFYLICMYRLSNTLVNRMKLDYSVHWFITFYALRSIGNVRLRQSIHNSLTKPQHAASKFSVFHSICLENHARVQSINSFTICEASTIIIDIFPIKSKHLASSFSSSLSSLISLSISFFSLSHCFFETIHLL